MPVATAEATVLALARCVTAIAAEPEPPGTSFAETLAAVFEAWGPSGPAGLALERARRTALDRSRQLMLGWAREQLRLALVEVLERETKAGRIRADLPADALSALVLAAADSTTLTATITGADAIDAILAVCGWHRP
jgi:hypothetical protein